MISIIVAYAANGVIGKQNDLPWYLPADLKRFKELTSGHTVIMGRRTFESIIARLGHPLPKRTNIVLTHNDAYDSRGTLIAHDLADAFSLSPQNEEVFIIGGSTVFDEALQLADRIYATEIKQNLEGDVFFPEFDKSKWTITQRESHSADEKNQFDYDFITYERKA